MLRREVELVVSCDGGDRSERGQRLIVERVLPSGGQWSGVQLSGVYEDSYSAPEHIAWAGLPWFWMEAKDKEWFTFWIGLP